MNIDDEKPDNFIDEPETPTPKASPDDPFAPLSEPTPAPAKPKCQRLCRTLLIAAAVVTVALGVAVWLRYFTPYTTDAQVSGYITSVERRGLILKTFEGQMITETSLTDTTRVYSRDFTFSVDNDSLALLIQSWQGSGRRVTLSYCRYYGVLPWRGASRNIVTGLTPR